MFVDKTAKISASNDYIPVYSILLSTIYYILGIGDYFISLISYMKFTLIYVRSMQKISVDSHAGNTAIRTWSHVKQTCVEITRV